jgi:glycosyltransferase involved in cell wall biosynthesis
MHSTKTGDRINLINAPLRVVHLSTSHQGGAGIAARRLHRELLNCGIDSYFLALKNPSYSLGEKEEEISRFPHIAFLGKIVSRFNILFKQKFYFSLFSISTLSHKKIISYGSISNTVIHVHNWFNLINLRTINKLLAAGYKVAFTLHDQRVFTGGCHYSLECRKFQSNCSKCEYLPALVKYIPKHNLKKMSSILDRYPNQVTFIAPSNWIKNLAQVSSVAQKIPVMFIPNFHYRFAPVLHKPTKNNSYLNIGIASVDKTAFLKGGEILWKVESLLQEKLLKVNLVYFSDFNKNQDSDYDFWQTIDYLLVPSILDNSPNVIHEAKLFGIPVIATNVGGVAEALNSKYDFIVPLSSDVHETIVKTFELILSMGIYGNKDLIIADYQRFVKHAISNQIEIYKKILGI